MLFTMSCHTTTFFSSKGLSSSDLRRFFPWFNKLLLRDSPRIDVTRLSDFSLLLRVLMLWDKKIAAKSRNILVTQIKTGHILRIDKKTL